MSDTLARRRYRLGARLFLGSVRWLRLPILLGLLAAPVLSVVFADAIETGLWRIVATVFQWFVASTAGIWLFTNLPTLLARGVTRRELTVAYLVFGALASVGTAALTTAGFAAEHALLDLFGAPLGTWDETLAAGARYLLITPIYFFTGTFIGAAATRFGDRTWFVVALLVACAGHYAGILALEFGDLDGRVAGWAAVSLAVTAVLMTASALALRSVPIRAKRA
jgi:hypothetical protein